FRFWTTKQPVFGPNPNKTEKPVPTHLRHIMDAENSQKGNSPTNLQTRYCPVCYRRSFFSAWRLFVLFHTSKAHSAIIAPAVQGSYYMAEAALFSLHTTKAGNHIHF
ncbi:MAG: hypothetical protein ACI307_10895, partial [Sodaliphilus sp.]